MGVKLCGMIRMKRLNIHSHHLWLLLMLFVKKYDAFIQAYKIAWSDNCDA
jgi:hypothetical protein